MNQSDLIHKGVEVDDEEVDESFDEETGEARPRINGVNGGGYHFEDSSEEEDDDDDEEAAREARSSPQSIRVIAIDCLCLGGFRSEKDSSSKTRMKQKGGSNGGGSGKREGGRNAKKKRRGWMMKILT